MLNKQNIKGVIFDYGGTIDSNGVHWGQVIHTAYQTAKVPVIAADFNDAYVHAERALGRNPIIEPSDNFYELLNKKIDIQLNYLVSNNKLPTEVASQHKGGIVNYCYNFAKNNVIAAKPVLLQLKGQYPLVLVSNFYGNIEAVLNDFELDNIFDSIIESAVVGVRKPDPEIFALGVKALGMPAQNTVVVGDSYTKDIEPAKANDCQTIWLNVAGWENISDTSKADQIIDNFEILTKIL